MCACLFLHTEILLPYYQGLLRPYFVALLLCPLLFYLCVCVCVCVFVCVEVFISWCCGGLDKRTVQNVLVLEHILLDWRIWHRAEEEVQWLQCIVSCVLELSIHTIYFHVCTCQVWQSILWQLQKLLSPEEAGEALDTNIECFHKSLAIIKILLTSKVT